MSVKKVVIACGSYNSIDKNILIGFDEQNDPIDIIDIDNTMVGAYSLASVEKVLNDFSGAILKLKNLNEKGFIETSRLDPEKYLLRHSEKKQICQCDEFYVRVTQDKKDKKPAGCIFSEEYKDDKFPFVSYYISEIAENNSRVIIDSKLSEEFTFEFEIYDDSICSLWALNDFTSILDKTLNNKVYLPNDGNIVIEKTEALTVVDVNTGKGKKKKDYFDTNLLAAKELARQIRLRNISGMIIVDFLKPMNNDQRISIIEAFRDSAKDDYCQVGVYSFTALGLLEITRSRKLSPLSQNFENTSE